MQGKLLRVTVLPRYYLHPWKSVLVCAEKEFKEYVCKRCVRCRDYRRVSHLRSLLQNRLLMVHDEIDGCALFCSHKLNCMSLLDVCD